VARLDYAFPFRVDAASGRAALTTYEAHVDQMIRQVLLTDPGERADLPEFGCGVRRLLFAPNSEPLQATTQIVVLDALQRWLSEHINVQQVSVVPPPTGSEEQILIQIDYVLIETQTSKRALVPVLT
jgi:phage baseplate assembly protein W